MNEIVTMKKLTVDRNDRQRVLTVDTFSIRRGELIALVGPNGAGKSTLLQTINLLQPYRGELTLFGEKPNSANMLSIRRRCSMVFQEVLLLKGSVFANVAWPLRFRGITAEELRHRVHKALVDFGCEHLADRPALELSGGEAQRVCLARALVTEPELLLLDEPFSSLDAATRHVLMEEIRSVAMQRGIAVIMVSHNFSDVLDFAERAVVLFDGCILQDDRPEILLRRPINQQVARLVGMDNILPCRLEPADNQQFLVSAGAICFVYAGPVISDTGYCCLPGDALTLHDGASGVTNHRRILLEGVIDRVTPGIGSYRVMIWVGELLLSVRLSREDAVNKLQAGNRIQLRFDPADAHII